MIKLSIVIVSYYNIPLILECIESIYRFNDIGNSLEVIVSDNSPDHSVAEYLKSNYSQVKCVANPNNGGFGYGNNRGAEVAEGDYLLFLNPDTVLVEPLFQFSIDKFEDNNDLAMFGVKLITKDGDSNISYMLMDGFGFYDYYKQSKCWKKEKFVSNKMFTSGADIFVRKDVFNQIGGFDENIFMYYEESDLLRRIILQFPMYYNSYFPDHRIIHLEGGTTKNSNTDSVLNALRRETESLKYYCDKYAIDFNKAINKILLKNKLIMFFNYLCRDKDKFQNRKTIYLFYKQYKKEMLTV